MSHSKAYLCRCLPLPYRLARDTARMFEKDAKTPSLVIGANVAGFLKVANAMKAQGDVW